MSEFPNVMTQQSAHADYVYLLEAVSAVLGAQREPKVDLLEESSSSSKDATPSHLQVGANRGAHTVHKGAAVRDALGQSRKNCSKTTVTTTLAY